MSKPLAEVKPWFEGSWDRIGQILNQFEVAWKSGQPPAIEGYLEVEQAERFTLLIELALLDLECRLRAGEAARVEIYFERFAELTADRRAAVRLIASEFDLRRRRESAFTQIHHRHLRNRGGRGHAALIVGHQQDRTLWYGDGVVVNGRDRQRHEAGAGQRV